MTILFFISNHLEFNQRAYLELKERGHAVNMRPQGSEASMLEAAAHLQPDLIVAPFLKVSLPEAILQSYTILQIKPSSMADRGPSSSKGSVMENLRHCRMSVLESAKEKRSQDISITPCPSMYAKKNFHQHHFNRSVIESMLKVIEKLEREQQSTSDNLSSRHQHPMGRLHSMQLN